VNGERRWQTI